MKKIDGFLVFNFLVKDKENLKEILAVTDCVIPGIVAADFSDINLAVKTIDELKSLSEIVSVGLGDDGNPALWEKVLLIAEQANPGHLNQPFEKSSYVKGYLEGKGMPQLVNALVNPTGRPGLLRLPSGMEMEVERFLDLIKIIGIESVKLMPATGHLDELRYLAYAAAERGIRGIEPAGGINESNVREIVAIGKGSGIEFFMPHIFDSVLDRDTGRTNPVKVGNILEAVGG